MSSDDNPCRDCKDVGAAINSVRQDIMSIEKRLLAQEIHADHHKSSVDHLRNDFMMMQGSFKIEIERLQKSLHTDIKMIQDTLNEIIKKQAVEEATLRTGFSVGRWVAERAPWLVAVAASFTAMIQFVKDKAS